MIFQRTLKKPVVLSGVGLHSGLPVSMRLVPAPIQTGIVFVRIDIPGAPEILGSYTHVVTTQLATTLQHHEARVSTVEHILAALHGLGIDNLRIEVDGPEIPIMDGSSQAFCELLLSTGLETQHAFRKYLILKKKIELKIAEKWAVAEPFPALRVHASIDWDHPSIGYQEFQYQEGKTPFTELANARTFGFLKDVEQMKAAGLARGGSLENAIILNETSVLNPGGLRSPNEFVKHKVLDALGDFKLAGMGLRANIRLHRAGHDLHHQLLVKIFQHAENYEIVDSIEEKTSPTLRFAVA